MGTGQEPVPRLSEGKPNQLAVLERRLAQALAERDGLARDVESLCLETSANTTFSYSSVLQERIFSAGAICLVTTIPASGLSPFLAPHPGPLCVRNR